MIGRDKLRYIKKLLREDRYDVSAEASQVLHALVDSNLEVLDQLEGGKSTQEQRAELKERERQVRLALADLRSVLHRAHTSVEVNWVNKDLVLADLAKGRFLLDMIEEMLKAKGPAWHREWNWYQPRIAEEFGEPARAE